MELNHKGNFNLESLCKSGQLRDDFKKYIVESQKVSVLIQILPEIFHKLKNKMTPILGYTQLLSLKAGNENIKERLFKIEKNTEELSFLLNQLSGYFKNDNIIRFRININDVISQMKSHFNEIEKMKHVSFKIDMDKNIPDDYLIFGQIEILITNMVDNAVQAIEKKISDSACGRFTQTEPGVVEIITRSGKGHYTLIIKDTGVGIKKESLPKIWIPFYSEFDVRPGLGLLLCEKIVKNHGAAIKVSSQEGAWTEFEVTFECKT